MSAIFFLEIITPLVFIYYVDRILKQIYPKFKEILGSVDLQSTLQKLGNELNIKTVPHRPLALHNTSR